MADRALRPCSKPGCAGLTRTTYCDRHEGEANAARIAYDKSRGTAQSRGYDSDWDKLRRAYRQEHPNCERCGRTPVTVHHRMPIGERPDLRLEPANLISLCASCHQRVHAAMRGAHGA